MNTTDMCHHESPEWNFALDVPRCRKASPPVPANSPYERIRFVSQEEGKHLLIVFREAYNPMRSLKQYAEQKQQVPARVGFGGFAGCPGFGTTDKAGMFPVFDRVAQSFAILTMVPESAGCRN